MSPLKLSVCDCNKSILYCIVDMYYQTIYRHSWPVHIATSFHLKSRMSDHPTWRLPSRSPTQTRKNTTLLRNGRTNGNILSPTMHISLYHQTLSHVTQHHGFVVNSKHSCSDGHTHLLCFSLLWLAVCRGPCGFYLGHVKNSQCNVMQCNVISLMTHHHYYYQDSRTRHYLEASGSS